MALTGVAPAPNARGEIFPIELTVTEMQVADRRLFFGSIRDLREQRRAEEEINRHLRLEIETLKSPQRIEALAIDRLKLVAPETGAAIDRIARRVTD